MIALGTTTATTTAAATTTTSARGTTSAPGTTSARGTTTTTAAGVVATTTAARRLLATTTGARRRPPPCRAAAASRRRSLPPPAALQVRRPRPAASAVRRLRPRPSASARRRLRGRLQRWAAGRLPVDGEGRVDRPDGGPAARGWCDARVVRLHTLMGRGERAVVGRAKRAYRKRWIEHRVGQSRHNSNWSGRLYVAKKRDASGTAPRVSDSVRAPQGGAAKFSPPVHTFYSRRPWQALEWANPWAATHMARWAAMERPARRGCAAA